MFSNNDKLYIPISGGTGWTKVPMNSNYPSQEIGKDGNMYAPVSEVNKPRTSAPIISNTNTSVVQDSRAYNPTSLYVDGLYNSTPESRMNYYYIREKQQAEEAKRQQEALITANINKALDIAASTQYRIMDKLYIEGGLDAMRKEYYRLSAGTEGYNSVYARAAYNSLCAKDKEEVPIREVTMNAANKYYNEGGIEGLKHLINYYKSNSYFNYASVAQSILSTKEKEEAINTPAVTKGANEYYETGGMESLKHLVKYYEENSYQVNANIAKRILKQKEEQEREEEHNRRMWQDPEYAENYKIKEAENEIFKLEKEIEEQKKIDPFAGQTLNELVINRKKFFEYSKNLGYEGAKAYLKELQLPGNERFFDAKVGASEAVRVFDKIIPLQNKIEQAKAKIQEIENVRTERILKQKEEEEHGKSKQFKEQQKEEQFQKIEFPFEETLKETYIVQKVSDEEVIEGSPVLVEPPTKEEDPSWWKMAKRAFNGDGSQEVLDWQKENRDKMRYIAAVFDGINEGAELFDEPLEKYKSEVLGTIKEGEKNIEDALESGELCETQQLIHRIKKIAYETTEKIADNVLPESMSDVGLMVGTLGIGAGVTKVVAKEAKKMLFSYKLYRKARSHQDNRSKVTGGRSAWEQQEHEDKLAAKMYEEIRASKNDVAKISENLNMPEFQAQRVKDHLFYNKHQLKHGAGFERFDPDFEIANAWKRLEAGTHKEADLQIFKHEHFESKFEGIFKTDYHTAHDAANRAGYPSGLRNNEIIEVKNGNINLHK